MAELDEKIQALQGRIDNLVKYQEYFYREISQLKHEINLLQGGRSTSEQQAPTPEQTSQIPLPKPVSPGEQPPPPRKTAQAKAHTTAAEPESITFEKFIGQNVLSIIGILILILGVGIGAKYAIDNNLISPVMRLGIGYFAGLALMAAALYLKKNYLNFSAVLMSGAMAVMYFITFFAYALYELLPQTAAFGLMLVLTAGTVFWALNYGKQVIAHIGLVGAYAIPFLLGGDAGNYAFLFSYIAIINIGILAVSVRRYWKWLSYNAFGFTWLIYLVWYITKFQVDLHFQLAAIFLFVFFLTFYITLIAHKLIFEESLATADGTLLITNSFVFYGFGYSLLATRGMGNLLGLFTIANAGFHFIFALIVSRFGKVTRELPVLLSGLVLTFVTIALPVQLDGHWLTLAWAMEALILFWLGRKRALAVFEYFSYPVMVFAGLSLLVLWQQYDPIPNGGKVWYPLFNSVFLTTFIFALIFGALFYVDRRTTEAGVLPNDLRKVLGYVFASVGLIVLYSAFALEIGAYFSYQDRILADQMAATDSYLAASIDLRSFHILWQTNYAMLFLSALGAVNLLRFRDSALAAVNLALNFLTAAFFFTAGTFLLTELRQSYLNPGEAVGYAGPTNIWIRYVSYAIAAALIFTTYRYTKQDYLKKYDDGKLLDRFFDVAFALSLLIVLSSELINWMDIGRYTDAGKLWLSILWGVYALALIVIGIYLKKIHLRISAIVLFGITLGKIFFYDISELSTIAKTVLFVLLGILMLVVSFLYNKYKAVIFGPDANESDG